MMTVEEWIDRILVATDVLVEELEKDDGFQGSFVIIGFGGDEKQASNVAQVIFKNLTPMKFCA